MGDTRHLWVRPFLAALAECGIITHAAKAAGVDRSCVFRYRQDNPEFAAEVEQAIEQAVDELEAEARRRALKGVEEPVYQGGVLVGTRVVFSDALMSLLLRGRRKAVFAERREITGADGGPVAVVADATQRASRATALLKLAEARKALADIDTSDLA
jgi:hypothetical protein